METYELYYLCDRLKLPRSTEIGVISNKLANKFKLTGNTRSILKKSLKRFHCNRDPKYHNLRRKFIVKKKVKSKKDNNAEWKNLRKRMLHHFGTKCMCCGRVPDNKTDVHIDHIKPWSRFPELEYDINNLQILCNICNSRKSNLHILDFRTEKQKFQINGIKNKNKNKNKDKVSSKPTVTGFSTCKNCKKTFYPLASLPYRLAGYCSQKCSRKQNKKLRRA